VADFSLRLAQRMIHMLSTHTASGTLYEVDVRLRPLGSAGLLVSHFNAFKKYLHENAWTFEHQALVKARMVVGADEFKNAFDDLRTEILIVCRDPIFLRKEIKLMREKMQEQHRIQAKKQDLKTISGGLADIDFIVQYAVLRYAARFPRLLNERASVNILQLLSDYRLMPEKDVFLLMQAYSEYQMLMRRKILQPEFDLRAQEGLQHHLAQVQAIWREIFLE
jgi:glutamate-ammonia-ligase adenylyltransferase